MMSMTQECTHEWDKLTEKKAQCIHCGKIEYISRLGNGAKRKMEEREAKKPRYEPEPVDLLKWVGARYYTIESKMDEMLKMGASERVPMVPRGVVPGKSCVFLVHDTSEADKEAKKRGGARVFAYFVVNGISYTVAPGMDLPEEFKKRGITKFVLQPGGFGTQDERGCGSLTVGATYLLSEEDMGKCRDLAQSTEMEGEIVSITPPVPFSGKRFRGYKHVSGERILAGDPEETWFDEAHEAYLRNRKRMRSYKRKLRRLRKKKEEVIEAIEAVPIVE